MPLDLVFIYLFCTVTLTKSFNLKCPHESHWRLRAQHYKTAANATCQGKKTYHCLLNTNSNSATEECFKSDDFQAGYQVVNSGNLDAKFCSDDRFAPVSILSHERYDCIYKKSTCTEDGQLQYKLGKNISDSTCRCDYLRGYKFVVSPKAKDACFCNPSEEDCSCYRHVCLDNRKLSPDYLCIDENSSSDSFKCEVISNRGIQELNRTNLTLIKADSAVTRMFGTVIYTVRGAITFVLLMCITFCAITSFKCSCVQRPTTKRAEKKLYNNVRNLTAFQEISRKLEEKHCVILKGRCGVGKFTIGSCLKQIYKNKDYHIIHLTEGGFNKTDLTHNAKYDDAFIFIDNCLFSSYFDQSKDAVCKGCLKVLISLMKSENKPLAVITTEYLPPDFEDLFGCDFHLFNLDQSNFYDRHDRQLILKAQMEIGRITLPDQTSNLLLAENPFVGFPKMCAIFCEDEDNLKLGVQFARDPPPFLIENIDQLQLNGGNNENFALQYCFLVALLFEVSKVNDYLGNQTLEIDSLKEPVSTLLKELYKNKHYTWSSEKIEHVIRSLGVFYLCVENSHIKFADKVVYQAVMLSHSKRKPINIREKCLISEILYFHRPRKHKKLKNEIVLPKNFSQNILFAKRICDEILKEGNHLTRSIAKALTLYLEKYNDEELFQRVAENMEKKAYTNYNGVLMFFKELKNSNISFTKKDLNVFHSSWSYIYAKKNNDSEILDTFRKKVDDLDFTLQFLLTLVDDFKNTLLHYFIVWNCDLENTIISDIVTFLKNKDKLENNIDFSKMENVKGHSPIHFAAYLGRSDMFSKLREITTCSRASKTYIAEKAKEIESLIDAAENYNEDSELAIDFKSDLLFQDIDAFRDKENFDDIRQLLA